MAHRSDHYAHDAHLELQRLSLQVMAQNTNALRAMLPQLWSSERLMDRYSSTWDEVKKMFRLHLELELGDKRTARVKLQEVLRMDECLAGGI